jgi:hypothetical protein
MTIRKVTTRNGERFVQSFPADESFWARWRANRPSYASVNKDAAGKWWVSVWGATKAEVKANLRDLHGDDAPSYRRQRFAECPCCGEELEDGHCWACGHVGVAK